MLRGQLSARLLQDGALLGKRVDLFPTLGILRGDFFEFRQRDLGRSQILLHLRFLVLGGLEMGDNLFVLGFGDGFAAFDVDFRRGGRRFLVLLLFFGGLDGRRGRRLFLADDRDTDFSLERSFD